METMTYIAPAHEAEEYVIGIVKKALALLESDNEIMVMNSLNTRKK